MNLKQIIAREWLIILVFFFLSPPVVAVYKWVSAPKTTTDESESFALYDYFIPDDQIPILRERLIKELKLTAPKPPANFELVPPEDLPDTLVIEQARKRGILTYAKRPFWNYVVDSTMNLDNYLAIILTYPLFLLIRSIIWSIGTVRRKEMKT
jgi:hypothetical protein